VGTLGTVARYDGTSFRREAIPGFSKTLAGATSGSGGTYVVGLDGALFRYADGAFAPIAGLPAVFLRAVAAPGESVFVAGWDGVVARVRGEQVLVSTVEPRRWLHGVYAAADDDVWIVGTSGLVLHGPPPRDPAADAGAQEDADPTANKDGAAG
jgi:hypothetical protein